MAGELIDWGTASGNARKVTFHYYAVRQRAALSPHLDAPDE